MIDTIRNWWQHVCFRKEHKAHADTTREASCWDGLGTGIAALVCFADGTSETWLLVPPYKDTEEQIMRWYQQHLLYIYWFEPFNREDKDHRALMVHWRKRWKRAGYDKRQIVQPPLLPDRMCGMLLSAGAAVPLVRNGASVHGDPISVEAAMAGLHRVDGSSNGHTLLAPTPLPEDPDVLRALTEGPIPEYGSDGRHPLVRLSDAEAAEMHAELARIEAEKVNAGSQTVAMSAADIDRLLADAEDTSAEHLSRLFGARVTDAYRS